MENNTLNKQIYSKLLKDRAERLKTGLNAPEGEHRLDPFLDSIQGLESSHGANTAHKTITEGIHQGDSAKGRFGILPNTALDISKKFGNTNTELGRSTQEVDLPEIQELKNLSKEELEQKLLDPEIELKLARLIAKELELKQRGDEERMSYGWNQGILVP